MFFGGFLLQITTIPVWLDWLKYLSWFMYTNEALLINQWKGVDDIKVCVFLSLLSSSLKCVFQANKTVPNGSEIIKTYTGDFVIEHQMGFDPVNHQKDDYIHINKNLFF